MNARYALLIAVIMALVTGTALAATKDELKKRTDARRPKIDALKRQGVIGETFQGMVEVVKSAEKDVQKLVSDENADRAEVYAQIAKEAGSTPDEVAAQAASKFFARAGKGEWLKYKDGWKQKG